VDAFTAEYLANLTADLTIHALAAAGRRLRETLGGSEEEQALRRCLQAGIVALLAAATAKASEELDLLADIFGSFFRDPDVGRELAAILRGNPPDVKELAYLFEQAGYDFETLPGLDFDAGLAAFEVAFLTSAAEEPTFQGIIQTHQLLAQTRLQHELVATMRELVAFLHAAQPGSVGIRAGQITAQNVVSGVQVVYTLSPIELPAQRDKAERHYLRTLISRCDPLDLTPIDEALPLEAEAVRISDVFTTLYLERLTRAPQQTVAEAIRGLHAPEPAMRRGREEQEERLSIQAVEAVAALPRLVILGRPGGGKSTLVNHIATQLAQRRLGQAVDGEKLPGWPDDEKPLPVRVILRRFAAWLPANAKRGAAGLVWDYLEHQLKQLGCREALEPLKQMLTEEGGVVFFDGLDEVRETDQEAKRSLIKEAIAGFAGPLEKCQIVVTCREYAYKQRDAWRLPEPEFPVVELALFNPAQVDAFTQTWYRVIGPQKGWSQEKCRDEARNLSQAVRSWPHLQELAQYPLLLTLMAQVHGRDGYLPQDRADLYGRAVNLLLAHWENRIVRDVDGSRRVEPGLVMQLGIRTEMLRSALERVAFAAHERQEREKARGEWAADIPREDLREELQADLNSLDKAEQVIAYIQERAGLLQARDNRTYAFPHRTFQEYLTATHVLKQGEFDTMLRDRVRRDQAWWQEVFLLAAGESRGTPRIISDLVDCLFLLGPKDRIMLPEKAAQAGLAAQALLETGFVTHVRKEQEGEAGRFSATYERVQAWLMAALRADGTLSPQERAAAGDALARLGDPRLGVGVDPETGLPDIAWCEVPAGPFLMGSDKAKDSQAYDDELPQHEVNLEGYRIGKCPVTNAQYTAFVAAGGYGERRYWTEAGWQWKEDRTEPNSYGGVFDLPNHPVVMVTWYEAIAFCCWLTERLRKVGKVGADEKVTLPSEAEWEKAARGGLPPAAGGGDRGGAGRIFPWGGDADPNRANYRDTGIGTTSAVGCFPGGASPYGVEDLSGNVWEWCRTKWQRSYEGYRDDNDLKGSDPRVLRGGAFSRGGRSLRCAFRHWYYPDYRLRYFGFRVVVAPNFISDL